MKGPFRYNATAVAVAIGLIAVSTIMLSYFSYVYWGVGTENLIDATGSMKLATQYVERIEQRIIENDHKLSEMILVDDPSTWQDTEEQIRNADFNVDHVFIFRTTSAYPIYPPYSSGISTSRDQVIRAFRDLDLKSLSLNQILHLHKERPDNYFFTSYVMKEDSHGERYVVFFEMNIQKTIAMIDSFLRDLHSDFYVSIVDFDNIGVYSNSQPISRSAKYFFEKRFPTTLYKWILQVVPRNYTELERNARNQRRAILFLTLLSMTLIFCSLAVIYVADRRERQLTQLKEDFISNVSHELKTPLSMIRMFSEILVTNRVKSDAARQEYYGIIFKESDRMDRLVSNLLDFARLERERHSLQFERTDIARLVLDEVEAYRFQIQKQGFELKAEVDSKIPEVIADPNAISMAFFNLLDNAVKYSGDSKRVMVSVSQNNGSIHLAVRDEGMGIPEAEREKIFEKFYRGSNAGLRKVRGSGIGLAITRQVAEMHGGEVRVESVHGRGSTFIMKIPIRREPASPETQRSMGKTQ
jgi:two-component system phosphate regulon sensor histidine kinase PhoR